MEALAELEAARAFAATLKNKSFSEAIGQLMLAFDMDMVSAKALMLEQSLIPKTFIGNDI